MLTFGLVLKFLHFYKPDFPSGKSAACFYALNHTQQRCVSYQKTPKLNEIEESKSEFTILRNNSSDVFCVL